GRNVTVTSSNRTRAAKPMETLLMEIKEFFRERVYRAQTGMPKGRISLVYPESHTNAAGVVQLLAYWNPGTIQGRLKSHVADWLRPVGSTVGGNRGAFLGQLVGTGLNNYRTLT